MLRIGDYKPELVKDTLSEVYELFEKGVFKPVVGGDYRVEEISSAHSFLESGKSKGKIVIRW
jgi:NADPH:quinone reductase-like Zn-dependent oxidoreductase